MDANSQQPGERRTSHMLRVYGAEMVFTRAYQAALQVELGGMTGEEADRWKDEMKDRDAGL